MDDVAEIVKNIILGDRSNLSVTLMLVVKAKLSDLTGNDVVHLVIKKYFGKE